MILDFNTDTLNAIHDIFYVFYVYFTFLLFYFGFKLGVYIFKNR